MKSYITGLIRSIHPGHTRQLYVLFFLMTLTMLISACKKEPDDENKHIVNIPKSTAIYVVNQGAFSGNNASVTMYDLETDSINADYFMDQNGRGLGDVASDLHIYGGKAYIVTNVSSQLEVVNAVTFKSIKQIPFFTNNQAQQPSAVTGYENKIYVTSYDGNVTVIDTTTLEIVKVIPVGLNPDAILAAFGKLWVSNSGGLNFPNYDNTVSVIDPATLTEIEKIEVGTNPFTLQADAYGDIYIITRGNYNDEKMRLRIIDPASKTIKKTFEDFEAYNFTIKGDTAYVYYHDFMGGTGSNIKTINVKTEEVISNNFIKDGTTIQTIYGIAADPTSGDIFITDAVDYMGQGKVYRFGVDGILKSSFDAGVNPVAVRFLLR